jgi:hypothetical protein
VAAVAEGIGYDVASVDRDGRLLRIEVKSCAARRARAPAQPGEIAAAAAGLNFYMSEAERRMAALCHLRDLIIMLRALG